MAEYCPACGETITGTAAVCPFCGQVLSPRQSATQNDEPKVPLAPLAQKQELITLPPPPIVVQQVPPPTRRPRNPDGAFYLEFLGMIGFLGIGQIYAGRVALGIVMLILWLVFFGGAVGSTFTLAYFCLFLPALLICYFSGRSARNYMRQQQGYEPPVITGGSPR